MKAWTLNFNNITDLQPGFKFGQDVWYVEDFVVRHCKVSGIRRSNTGFVYELLDEHTSEIIEKHDSLLYPAALDALFEVHTSLIKSLEATEAEIKKHGGSAYYLKRKEIKHA